MEGKDLTDNEWEGVINSALFVKGNPLTTLTVKGRLWVSYKFCAHCKCPTETHDGLTQGSDRKGESVGPLLVCEKCHRVCDMDFTLMAPYLSFGRPTPFESWTVDQYLKREIIDAPIGARPWS